MCNNFLTVGCLKTTLEEAKASFTWPVSAASDFPSVTYKHQPHIGKTTPIICFVCKLRKIFGSAQWHLAIVSFFKGVTFFKLNSSSVHSSVTNMYLQRLQCYEQTSVREPCFQGNLLTYKKYVRLELQVC